MLAPIRSSHRTIRNKGAIRPGLTSSSSNISNQPPRKKRKWEMKKSEHTKKTRELVDGISNGTVPAGGRPPGELVGSYILPHHHPPSFFFSSHFLVRASNERKWRQRRRLATSPMGFHSHFAPKKTDGSPIGPEDDAIPTHTSDSFS